MGLEAIASPSGIVDAPGGMEEGSQLVGEGVLEEEEEERVKKI